MRFPMPLAAGDGSVRFVYLVPNHGCWPPRPRAAVEPAVAGLPARVRDQAAVGMIRPAGLAGLAGLANPAAETLAEENQALDERSGMRWAPPEDTPGRIGPFNPGLRRDRSGP
jgi:hypothetical protein